MTRARDFADVISGQFDLPSGALDNSIAEVSDDTAPVLGGNLDVGGNEITSASNGNVVVNPNGTGTIELEAATNVTGNTAITGTFGVTGNTTVTGTFGVTGDTTVTGDLLPEADGTRDLGATGTRFANVFADVFTSGDMVLNNTDRPFVNDVDGTQGRWRIQEGADSLFIINELTGQKYKFVLEAI